MMVGSRFDFDGRVLAREPAESAQRRVVVERALVSWFGFVGRVQGYGPLPVTRARTATDWYTTLASGRLVQVLCRRNESYAALWLVCGFSGTKYLLMSSCGSDPCPFGGKHACVCDADGRDGDILIRVFGPDTYGSRSE